MIYLNDINPEVYHANLLDFSTGTCGPDVSYFSSKTDLFFVKFTSRAALRTITLKFEFTGATEYDTVKSISDFTACVMKTADFKLPDGFCYHCMLTKAGAAKRISEQIYTADFTFVGFRHGPQQKEPIEQSKSILVSGNFDCSCILSFLPSASGSYVQISNDSFTDRFVTDLTTQASVVFDGFKKKVTLLDGTNIFGSCTMNNFPRLANGKNVITLHNVSNVSISYLPIYV